MDLSILPYTPTTYRECLRNHAAALGGHAFDGCGEFMPKALAGTLALHCAACGCHRNFHRQSHRNPNPSPPPPPIPCRSVPPPPAGALDRARLGSETPPLSPPPAAAEVGGRKRFRTKFTPEQKEKMAAFGGKIGWRIQKHDGAALQRFCSEIGVTRHVLKVWMHNNKHHHHSAGD